MEAARDAAAEDAAAADVAAVEDDVGEFRGITEEADPEDPPPPPPGNKDVVVLPLSRITMMFTLN